MPVAEIIAIGTELLLGEIQDTNTRFLARSLRDKGIDIYRATLVGDNAARISGLMREAAGRADIVITTGGLGPTVDDPTRDAAALAMGVRTDFSPVLWQQIEARFARMGRIPTGNNRRQAFLPQGAQAIENPVGTAPAFYGQIENSLLVCLPGVPREMEYLLQNAVLPLLEERFGLHETIRALVLHCAGAGESQVDEWIGDLETSPNPTVGLLAHPGIVDIRVTAKAASLAQAGRMISEMAGKIRERVGDAIFGEDADTLEGAVAALLHLQGKTLLVAGDGSQSAIVDRLVSTGSKSVVACDLPESPIRQMALALQQEIGPRDERIGLAMALTDSEQHEGNRLAVAFVTAANISMDARQYTGPEGSIPTWAANFALNYLRLNLISHQNQKEG